MRLIHESCHRDLRKMLGLTLILLLIIPLTIALPDLPGAEGIANYVPLHTLLETVSIVISMLIFAIGLATQKDNPSLRTRWLAYMFLGVALLDFTHMLSFEGMPPLVTDSGAEKAINFWLAARLFTAIALIGAVLIPEDSTTSTWSFLLPWTVLTTVSFFHIWFLYFPQTVPRTFIYGEGLTSFKTNAEYFLITAYLLAAILYMTRMTDQRGKSLIPLVGASLTAAMAEYYFTLYAELTDIYNFLGHIYKIIAYLFLYNGIFVTMVRTPYQQATATRSRLEATIDALPDLLLEIDTTGKCIRVLSYGGDLPERVISGLEGTDIYTLVSDESATVLDRVMETTLRSGDSQKLRTQLTLKGVQRDFELSISAINTEDKADKSLLLLAHDITEKTAREAELKKLSSILDQSPFPIIITDSKANIEYINHAFTESSGYGREEVIGRNPGLLKSESTPSNVYKSMWSQLSRGRSWSGELHNKRKDGSEYIEQVHIHPIKNSYDEIIHYLAYKEDITEKKLFSSKLLEATRFDQLTGLPNRLLLEDRFGKAVKNIKPSGNSIFLMFIDIDKFRVLNDALGWDSGNIILREIGVRLQEAVGPGNTLARNAGDEFIAFFPECDMRTAITKAQELLDVTNKSIPYNEQEVLLTSSIGIACYPDDGKTYAALQTSAEAAMHAAKTEGRNRYHFFAPQLQANAVRRHMIGNALRLALELNEFHLVFQPKVSLKTGQCVGLEALLRWTHPTLGTISPSEFITIAEQQGSISAIGDWVVRESMRQQRSLQDAKISFLPISINISAIQLNTPDLVKQLEVIAQETGVTPDMVELELTEAVTLRNPDKAVKVINDLRKAGFSISIDDFGTGYSSFQYLKRFNIQRLKIDISFIRDLDTDPRSRAIVKAIIQMAHSLNLQVIAEGAETQTQRLLLTELGCDELQGYIYSKPLSQTELKTFLSNKL